MAAGTALAVAGGISALGGVAQSVVGAGQTKQAREAIENYDRQELTNAFDNVSISTLGSDLISDQNALASANAVNAARSGGVASVMAALPQIVAQNNIANQNNAQNLDVQLVNREINRAQDNANIRGMMEARENADLAGLGNQLNVGQQNIWNGIGDSFQGVGGIANGLYMNEILKGL